MKAIFAAALLVAGGIAFAEQKPANADRTSTNTATVDNSTANPVGDKPSAPPENTPRDKKPDKADKPAAPPTNTPAEKPLPGNKNADHKDSKTTKEDKLPSPAELIKRIKAMDAEKAKKSKIAYFDLSTRPVTEAPAGFSLFGDDGSMTLRSIIERMHQARDDKEIKGVLITLGEGGLNFSQAQELRGALRDLTKAGKNTYVYADSYDTDTYIMASGAKHVCMLEGGEIMIPGVGLEATFYKGLFDKVGIKADYVQIGEYKGADEEYTRTEASPELKGELTKLTSSLYDQIVNVIASSRNISTDDVKQIIDDTILTGPQAKAKGMVDDLTDQDSLRALISKEVGNDVDLVADYGRTRETADLSNPMNILALMMKKPAPESNNPQVALIYAEGVIVDGEAGDGLFSEGGVGSETMRKAMRIAARDENIKAIVIRIDSPGGSALASEVMWQAVRHAAEKKPVIISVGSMAASGGYYLASAGDKIFADPSAIVGSIGVVGGKFVYKGVYDWAGVHAEAFSKGKNAGLFSSSEPWDDRQKLMVTKWMQGTYKQFTQRVMKTRGGKIKDIDKVARGRIFVASEAKALGMVDEIGGIEDALAYAAKDAGLDSGKYDVRIVPAPKSLGDLLMGGGPEAAFAFKPTIQISPDSILNAAPPDLRRSIARELQMVRMLQEHPVVLMSPFNVEIH